MLWGGRVSTPLLYPTEKLTEPPPFVYFTTSKPTKNVNRVSERSNAHGGGSCIFPATTYAPVNAKFAFFRCPVRCS